MISGKQTRIWERALFVLLGAASLGWFLARVIPKPSRAAYPCQRASAPLAGGFLVWLAGMAGARILRQRALRLGPALRWSWAAGVAATALLLIWLPLAPTDEAAAQRGPVVPFQPSEGPNAPMGTGVGIHPGRVVWVHDPSATRWDGKSGNWWDDANTDQAAVDRMMEAGLRDLTGAKTASQAWEMLFRHFNRTHGGGERGYRRGERIAIKINCNQDRSPEWGKGARPLNGLPSPQAVYALVRQLIDAGVPGQDILLYEAAQGRNIGPPIYNKIRANPKPDFQAVQFVVNNDYGLGGRVLAKPDKSNPIHFAEPSLKEAFLPQPVVESRYMINMALFRPHGLAGVTLCAKNHFGSVYFPEAGGWTPRSLHNYISRTSPLGSYNPLVELIGHRHLGGKTVLYLIDGLYQSEHNEGNVIRFASFGDGWAASLFLSQDPVAIDSVALDFLAAEPRATNVTGNPDNYLHEAALAGKPPSGVRYDPEGDGVPLQSLGVHEHWNNPKDKKYSRNLGKKEGIELVAVEMSRKAAASGGSR
jgi:hypothetical protein